MVTDLVSYKHVLRVAEAKGLDISALKEIEPEIMADKESRKREPRPPAPKGGISIRGASRKYEISKSTIFLWVKKGYVPVIPSKSIYEKFIDESRIAQLAKVYKADPGRGSWAVRNFIHSEQTHKK